MKNSIKLEASSVISLPRAKEGGKTKISVCTSFTKDRSLNHLRSDSAQRQSSLPFSKSVKFHSSVTKNRSLKVYQHFPVSHWFP